jgi:hypothetical protein
MEMGVLMKKVIKIVLCLALVCPNGITASPLEQGITRKNDSTSRILMAQFLALLGGIALVIAAKDKEQRFQAAAQIINGLATVAQIMVGNATSSDDEKQNAQNESMTHKRAYQILSEHPDFIALFNESRADIRALLEQALTALDQQEEPYCALSDNPAS